MQRNHLERFISSVDSSSCAVQVLRSVGPWSLGRKTENSIEQAYIDAIAQAEKFIHIETHVTYWLTTVILCDLSSWFLEKSRDKLTVIGCCKVCWKGSSRPLLITKILSERRVHL